MKPILERLLQIQAIEIDSNQDATRLEEIQNLRRRIPAPFLKYYDHRRSRGKLGVALVRNGVCGQCHMQVATGLFASLLRLDETMHCCQNCGVYLSLEDEPLKKEEPPKAEPVKRRKARAAAPDQLVAA